MTANSTSPIDTLETLLADRYSCRGFTPDPVPQDTIERILKAAQKTASWCNSQPWQIVVTSGDATQKFREAMVAAASSGAASAGDFPFPREYRGVYQDRRRESGFQLYEAVGIARGDRAASAKQAMENFNLFGAPHAAIIHTDEALGVYGAVDCGGYVSNFMLAAQALGVATVPQAALAFHSGIVREHFGLGDDRKIVCGISFGFADTAHKANSYRTSRAPMGEVATFVK